MGRRRIGLTQIVDSLAPTLGHEESVEAVERAVHALALRRDEADPRLVLRHLGAQAGIVGAAARFAEAKLGQSSDSPKSVPRAPEPPKATAPGKAGKGAGPVSAIAINELIALFVPSMGLEKGAAVVRDAGTALGLSDQLSPAEVMMLLERLASGEGIVAIVAQFARARFSLRQGAPPAGARAKTG